jgi:hypothetical protein
MPIAHQTPTNGAQARLRVAFDHYFQSLWAHAMSTVEGNETLERLLEHRDSQRFVDRMVGLFAEIDDRPLKTLWITPHSSKFRTSSGYVDSCEIGESYRAPSSPSDSTNAGLPSMRSMKLSVLAASLSLWRDLSLGPGSKGRDASSSRLILSS